MRESIVTGCEIMPLNDKSKKGDKRGSVFEWKNITNKKVVQISTFVRKKGSISGNHFHKGTDPSKNPELFLLASGRALVSAYNKKTNEKNEKEIKEGTVLINQPNVLHTITALTDIVYIEPRITEFDEKNPDTFPRDEYEKEHF